MFNNDDGKIIQENLGRLELSTVKTEVVLTSQGFIVNKAKECKLGKILMFEGAFENTDCLDEEQKSNLIAQVNNL